jgi:hypothetical protein
MNNLRISILSVTIILFSLGALMLPVNTTLAHHCKGGHKNNEGCPVDTDVATYNVAITGAVLGASGPDWRGSGKNTIGLGVVGGTFGPGNSVGQLTDLSFFTMSSPFGPFSDVRGIFCFGSTPFFLGAANLKQGKHGGQAEGNFIFRASTDEGMTEVQYRLFVAGIFNGEWPPSDPEMPTTMTMDTWELVVSNASGPIRNRSCVGDGDFINNLNGLEDQVVITVTLVE